MSKQLIIFILVLISFLAIAFFGHVIVFKILNRNASVQILWITYAFNFFLTVLFFGLLLYFSKKRTEQLGFIFMFSSLAKFILFFLVIKPYLASQDISKSITFWSFFVPYAISLTLECIALVRILKKS